MRTRITTAALALIATLLTAAAPSGDKKDDGPSAKLTAGSVWNGIIHADDRQANGKSYKAVLMVHTRDGKTFDGEFFETGQHKRSLDVKGEVDDNGKLRIKPTKITKGGWGNKVLDKVWLGEVKGEKLTFRVVDGESDPNAQGQEAELTLKS